MVSTGATGKERRPSQQATRPRFEPSQQATWLVSCRTAVHRLLGGGGEKAKVRKTITSANRLYSQSMQLHSHLLGNFLGDFGLYNCLHSESPQKFPAFSPPRRTASSKDRRCPLQEFRWFFVVDAKCHKRTKRANLKRNDRVGGCLPLVFCRGWHVS